MQDHTPEAEALFRAFAERHSLTIRKVKEPNVELLMELPRQPGLSFDLTLGLQNADELSIGFEGFWSYIFPFNQKHELVSSLLDGIVSGACRLAVHRQFGLVVKRVLERRVGDNWEPIYQALGFGVPFIGTQVAYLSNNQSP
ncbi:MAG: hypothetical protein M0D54_01275 [Hyphomonadaceae bacterium JAD_PAG50586_4]|nr:MAG: hypothetical protein M0D54_01275 [Hyphomonadaceae bacterium JAD_PAG50586_4]